MITFGQLYRSLSSEEWWSSQPEKVRVLAARYYTGIDSYDQLVALSKPAPVFHEQMSKPVLTDEQVDMIRMLR